MADAGIQDILIANEVVGRRKIERLMALAARCDIMVAVDDPQISPTSTRPPNLQGQPPRPRGSQHRPQPLRRRARHRRRSRPRGLPSTAPALLRPDGYEGHIIDLEDKDARDDGARTCLQRLVDARDAVNALVSTA